MYRFFSAAAAGGFLFSSFMAKVAVCSSAAVTPAPLFTLVADETAHPLLFHPTAGFDSNGGLANISNLCKPNEAACGPGCCAEGTTCLAEVGCCPVGMVCNIRLTPECKDHGDPVCGSVVEPGASSVCCPSTASLCYDHPGWGGPNCYDPFTHEITVTATFSGNEKRDMVSLVPQSPSGASPTSSPIIVVETTITISPPPNKSSSAARPTSTIFTTTTLKQHAASSSAPTTVSTSTPRPASSEHDTSNDHSMDSTTYVFISIIETTLWKTKTTIATLSTSTSTLSDAAPSGSTTPPNATDSAWITTATLNSTTTVGATRNTSTTTVASTSNTSRGATATSSTVNCFDNEEATTCSVVAVRPNSGHSAIKPPHFARKLAGFAKSKDSGAWPISVEGSIAAASLLFILWALDEMTALRLGLVLADTVVTGSHCCIGALIGLVSYAAVAACLVVANLVHGDCSA